MKKVLEKYWKNALKNLGDNYPENFRYSQYRNFCQLHPVASNESYEDALKLMAAKRITETYDQLFFDFIANLRTLNQVTDKMYDLIKERLRRFRIDNTLNEEYLLEIRRIEEDFFDRKLEVNEVKS